MSWILTRSGRKFDLAMPTAAMVDAADIAHSLSMQCRFNGHTTQFYSVAQHCMLVADLVPAKHQLAALLHDATEAYVGDLVRPLKEGMRHHTAGLGGRCLYEETEERIWFAICDHFHLDYELPACVRRADLVALATEKRELMPEHHEAWPCLDGIEAHPDPIQAWQPSYAVIHYHHRLLSLMATTHRSAAV